MTVWVDGDSCPPKVREVVCRAALRLRIPAVFVANRPIPFPANDFTRMQVVPAEAGAADDALVAQSAAGELAVTRDLPLAERLLAKKVAVINDRGDEWTADTIRERLSVRNTMQVFREMGIYPEKPSQFGQRELQRFAATFDTVLSRLLRP